MSRPYGPAPVVPLLRTPGVRRAVVAATLSRLSYGTVSLSLLLSVKRSTGSFGVAGAALGAYGLATLVLPLKARAIDRYGRRPVLVPLAAVYAAVLALVAAVAARGVPAALPYVVLSALAGLLTPPVGPVMRGIWAALTPGLVERRRAYALDTAVEQAAFVGGPLLVGVVVALVDAPVALLGTALLALVGALGLAASAAARPQPVAGQPQPAAAQPQPVAGQPQPVAGQPRPIAGRRRLLGPLVSPGLRRLLVPMVGTGLGLSLLEVAVAARAGASGHPAAVGYLLGALSAGGVVGGLLWARLRQRRPYGSQLARLSVALAAGAVLAALTTDLLALAVVLAVSGLAVTPVFVVSYLAADAVSAPGERMEATTWVGTASNAGSSLGAAAGGVLIDATGPSVAILLAAATFVAGAVAAGRLRDSRRGPRR